MFFILWVLDFKYTIFDSRAILFFSFGALFSIKNIDPQKLKFHKYYLVFLFIWMLLILSKTYLKFIDFKNDWLIDAFHNSSVLVGIASIWYTYDFFFEGKDISKTTIFNLFKYGFFTYITHEPLLTILKKGLYYIFGFSELNSFIIYIVAPSITISLSITVAHYMKKNIPVLYSLLSGGR